MGRLNGKIALSYFIDVCVVLICLFVKRVNHHEEQIAVILAEPVITDAARMRRDKHFVEHFWVRSHEFQPETLDGWTFLPFLRWELQWCVSAALSACQYRGVSAALSARFAYHHGAA